MVNDNTYVSCETCTHFEECRKELRNHESCVNNDMQDYEPDNLYLYEQFRQD